MPDQATFQDSLIGLEFGHYRILERVGGGGMGVVYRARDEHLDREVAIKVLTPGTITDESARRHLRKEAVALSKLNHANIAAIHDFDTQQGLDFLVMEYVSGEMLSRRSAASALSEKEIGAVGLQIAQALEEAHEHGVIHRDLKPANIVITSKGQVKVLDFGLAKFFDPKLGALKAETLTESVDDSHLIGTLPYMAPEQVSGEHIDARTDIYGLGVVLYEMATQQRPFREQTTPRLFDSILHQAVVAPRALNPRISPELERIILKCLEKEAENRYQSAKELAIDLRRLTIPSVAAPFRAAQRMKRPWVRRAAVPGILLALAAIAVGGALLLRSRSAHALTSQDTIVLADFANTTGDPVFTDTLRQGLVVQLNQSPFLNILSDDKVRTTLEQMGHQPQDPLNDQVAREICQRRQSKAFISGSIASLGSRYVLGLKAVNCATGEVLAQQQSQVAKKEEVLESLGKQASLLRRKLGESLPSIQKFDVPLEQATTSSLEALQAFSLGRKAFLDNDESGAIPLFQRAIRFDPNFAMAYAMLGQSYLNSYLGKSSLGIENFAKAYELRERASEREKFYIETHYYEGVLGDLEKARTTYELWAQFYPRDCIPHSNLGLFYAAFGQLDKGLAQSREALSLEMSAKHYDNLVGVYVVMNRIEEAKATAREAQAKNFDSPAMHFDLYTIAFLQDDVAGMKEQVDWMVGKPEEELMLGAEADTLVYSGQLKKALGLRHRAKALEEHGATTEKMASYELGDGWYAAHLGNLSEARERATAALALSKDIWTECAAGHLLAMAGDSSRAQAVAEDLAKRFTDNTYVRSVCVPLIQARIALARTEPAKAIELLQVAAPYELGMGFDAVYPRGEAYLAARQGAEAVIEFQKILDHRGLEVGPCDCSRLGYAFIVALAHLQIGRAYAMQGDTAKAKAAYQDFLTLWKDADPDIPILKQAKTEYAKLQ